MSKAAAKKKAANARRKARREMISGLLTCREIKMLDDKTESSCDRKSDTLDAADEIERLRVLVEDLELANGQLLLQEGWKP